MTFIITAYRAAAFGLRHNLSIAQHIELQALCALTLCRSGSPTGIMTFGQARAFARRIAA